MNPQHAYAASCNIKYGVWFITADINLLHVQKREEEEY